jgi:hypothetical protein
MEESPQVLLKAPLLHADAFFSYSANIVIAPNTTAWQNRAFDYYKVFKTALLIEK